MTDDDGPRFLLLKGEPTWDLLDEIGIHWPEVPEGEELLGLLI